MREKKQHKLLAPWLRAVQRYAAGVSSQTQAGILRITFYAENTEVKL